MRKVVNSIWFSQMGNTRPIGIVKVEGDEYEKQPLFYIGNADGYDKSNDEKFISETGARFPADEGLKLLP